MMGVMGAMEVLLFAFVIILIAENINSSGISSKLDLPDGDASASPSDADDVEVKHTIVVSTKVNKNHQRRGVYGAARDSSGDVIYNFGKPNDDDEVPIIKGYKAVETTRIRTPDTRNKPKNTETVFITRNLQDGYNLYPEYNPSQWKPSTLFNNINWWAETNNEYSLPRTNNDVNFQRKVTDESMKEFYCKRCRELSRDQNKDCYGAHIRSGWSQQSFRTTTPKVKIDGKIAKLN